MPDQPQSIKSRREELLAAVQRVGVPEAVRRIKSVVDETQHWAVTVYRNGEEIVTIESNSLSGRELSEEDEKIIGIAARHLLGFIGEWPKIG